MRKALVGVRLPHTIPAGFVFEKPLGDGLTQDQALKMRVAEQARMADADGGPHLMSDNEVCDWIREQEANTERAVREAATP